MNTIFNMNYESLERVINRDHKINLIFKNIIKNIKTEVSQTTFTERTMMGYRYNKIGEGSKVYIPRQWFYPESIQMSDSQYCFDIYTASAFALYYCGGVHAYTLTKDVKLLILDKETVTKLINEIIDPLMMNKNKSVNGSMTYYYYIKLYLKYELDMLNCTELRDLNKVKSTGVDGNYPTEHFLSSFAEKMGFDGVIHIGRKGIYKLIENGLKIVINSPSSLKRRITNKYDWSNWGLDNYIVPITEFELNVDHFGKRNIGFSAYNFYQSSLLPCIKTAEEYDFGTLNINQLISINKRHTKDECMKALIGFINKHKLKFICLQECRYGDIPTFNKFIEANGMYSSVGDFERKYFTDNDVCNVVVSTSNLIILNNELLPGDNKKHFILFRHPNYRGKTFINTQLSCAEQLNVIKKNSADYILGNLNISRPVLQTLGYAINSDSIYGTTLNNIQTDFILSKLPVVLQSVVAINYKYSHHKALIGKK